VAGADISAVDKQLKCATRKVLRTGEVVGARVCGGDEGVWNIRCRR